MKVRVVLVVEIDREKYNREYWERASAAEVRDYVQTVVQDAAQHSALYNLDAKVSLAKGNS